MSINNKYTSEQKCCIISKCANQSVYKKKYTGVILGKISLTLSQNLIQADHVLSTIHNCRESICILIQIS